MEINSRECLVHQSEDQCQQGQQDQPFDLRIQQEEQMGQIPVDPGLDGLP